MNRLLAATLCAVYYHGVLVWMLAAVFFNAVFVFPAKAQLQPAPETWDEIFKHDNGSFEVVCYNKGSTFKYCGTRTYFSKIYGPSDTHLLSWTWGYDGDKRMMFKLCHNGWYGKGVTGEWKPMGIAFLKPGVKIKDIEFFQYSLMFWSNNEPGDTFGCFEGWGELDPAFVKSYILHEGQPVAVKIGEHLIPHNLEFMKVSETVKLAIAKAVEFRRK